MEVKAAQEQKLESLKKQQEVHTRLALERKLFLRDKKIKFFERRKIERRIRRLEKLQRASSSSSPDQLASLKHDLQYVMVSVFLLTTLYQFLFGMTYLNLSIEISTCRKLAVFNLFL